MIPDPSIVRMIDDLNARAWETMIRSSSEAALLAEEAIRLSVNVGYEEGRALAFLNVAWGAYYRSDLSVAECSGLQALELFTTLNDLAGISMAFNLLGAVDHERGEPSRALDRYMKALELAGAAGRKDREASSLNNVGEVLKDSGEVRQALEYFMRASDAGKEADAAHPVAVEFEAQLFANIGQCFIELGETENAVDYLELALGAAKASGDSSAQVISMKGLATAARRRGGRTEAKAILDAALASAERSGKIQAAVETRVELALLFIEADDSREARAVLDTAIADATRTGFSRRLSECYRLRSLASETLGDYEAALADFKRFNKAESDLAAERIAQSSRGAEIRFELERSRTEAEIFRLRNVELKEGRAELERTNSRLKAVTEIGRSITASLDMDDVTRTVWEGVSLLMDATGFSLAVLDPTRKDLVYRLCISDGKSIPTFSVPADSPDSFAAWVVSHNESLRIDDAQTEYLKYIGSSRLAFEPLTSSLIFVPLSLGDRVIGAVGVQSRNPHAYHEEDVRLLAALGSFITVAIENSRTHEEVRRLNEELRDEKEALERLARRISKIANHDGLTGLPNRLLLGELLEKSLSRAARMKTRVALMFMDLDDFKPINDRFGHLAGDQALIEVSKRLKSALRDSDVVARVGGDEFVAVVSDVEDEGAVDIVAGKLCAMFLSPIEVQKTPCTVGISIGIAIYPEAAMTADELMRRADEAMYLVKKGGKNGYRVCGK